MTAIQLAYRGVTDAAAGAGDPSCDTRAPTPLPVWHLLRNFSAVLAFIMCSNQHWAQPPAAATMGART